MDKNEKLKVLREVTKLDPISYVRVYRECKRAENYREILARLDQSHTFSVDYTTANELEYDLRMRTLTNNLATSWNQYRIIEKGYIGLDEFVENYIDDYAERHSKGRTLKI